MSKPSEPTVRNYLSRSEIDGLSEVHVRHPLNASSDVFLKRLAPILGLSRLALYVARVPPGKESFQYHRHELAEEFVLILQGRGIAEIGEQEVEVAPGDLFGFPAPGGPAHHLRNPFESDLVYLMGGESPAVDIAHFPRQGLNLIFKGEHVLAVRDEDCRKLRPSDWLAD